MCTTANINAYREVPPGRGGLSFSFDPDHATLRGPGPNESVQAATTDYEALAGRAGSRCSTCPPSAGRPSPR